MSPRPCAACVVFSASTAFSSPPTVSCSPPTVSCSPPTVSSNLLYEGHSELSRKLDGKMLKDMFASSNRKKFARQLLEPLIEKEIKKRKRISEIVQNRTCGFSGSGSACNGANQAPHDSAYSRKNLRQD